MNIHARIRMSNLIDTISKKLPDDEDVKSLREFADIHRGLIEINGVETEVTFCFKPQADWVEYILNDEVYLTDYKNIKPIRN